MKYSVIEKLMGKILGKLSWDRGTSLYPRWRVFCRVKESCDFSGSVWTVEARRAVESTNSFLSSLLLYEIFLFFFSFFWTRRFNLCFLLFRFLCNIPGYCDDSRGWTMAQLKSCDILALQSVHFSFFLSFLFSFLVSQSMDSFFETSQFPLILKILQSFLKNWKFDVNIFIFILFDTEIKVWDKIFS